MRLDEKTDFEGRSYLSGLQTGPAWTPASSLSEFELEQFPKSLDCLSNGIGRSSGVAR
jgi:hypothetical protein